MFFGRLTPFLQLLWRFIKNCMKTLAYDLHLHSCLSPCGIMIWHRQISLVWQKSSDWIWLHWPTTIPAKTALLSLSLLGIWASVSARDGINYPEEVHVLCYFASLDAAMDFDRYVSDHLPDTPNKPMFFGDQLIYNEQDQISCTEQRLLISATDLPWCHLWSGKPIWRHYGSRTYQ